MISLCESFLVLLSTHACVLNLTVDFYTPRLLFCFHTLCCSSPIFICLILRSKRSKTGKSGRSGDIQRNSSRRCRKSREYYFKKMCLIKIFPIKKATSPVRLLKVLIFILDSNFCIRVIFEPPSPSPKNVRM